MATAQSQIAGHRRSRAPPGAHSDRRVDRVTGQRDQLIMEINRCWLLVSPPPLHAVRVKGGGSDFG